MNQMITKKYRIVLSSFIYLILMSLPLFLFIGIKMIPEHKTCPQTDSELWFLCAESRGFLVLTAFATISGAAVFGSLGAIFSVLSRRANDLFDSNGIMGVCFFGSLAAVILCLIFAGGFIGGTLFPQYSSSELGWFSVIYAHDEFSKLLVWSFVIGFSERVLPNFLDSLARKFKLESKETKEG